MILYLEDLKDLLKNAELINKLNNNCRIQKSTLKISRLTVHHEWMGNKSVKKKKPHSRKL